MKCFDIKYVLKYNLQLCAMYSIALNTAMHCAMSFATFCYEWFPYQRIPEVQSAVPCNALHCTEHGNAMYHAIYYICL